MTRAQPAGAAADAPSDIEVGGVALGFDTLALLLLRATQTAAIAAVPWAGRGQSKEADRAAVEAMRSAFNDLTGHGVIVIGEGEKDDAPMLFNGEEIGEGGEPAFDLAVDPLENTKACAGASEGAVAVAAAAPRGALYATPGYYMDKLIVPAAAASAIDIARPVKDNLAAIADALGKPVDDLTAVVLDKPRHEELVANLREAGAKVALIPEGDILGALRVLLPGGDADLLIGTGGAPEGIINACAVRLLGGGMHARLDPQDDAEAATVRDAGQSPDTVLRAEDLVTSEDCCFLVTGVTSSALLAGPRRVAGGWWSSSIMSSPLHPMLRVEALHQQAT